MSAVDAEFPGRFALFLMDTYYPGGGFYDCFGTFPTEEAAKEFMLESSYRYDDFDIIDLIDMASKERRRPDCQP